MVKKNCPYCKKDSYSTSTKGIWICPYCHKDISDVPANNPTAKLGNILVSLLQNYQCTDNQEWKKRSGRRLKKLVFPAMRYGLSCC